MCHAAARVHGQVDSYLARIAASESIGRASSASSSSSSAVATPNRPLSGKMWGADVAQRDTDTTAATVASGAHESEDILSNAASPHIRSESADTCPVPHAEGQQEAA